MLRMLDKVVVSNALLDTFGVEGVIVSYPYTDVFEVELNNGEIALFGVDDVTPVASSVPDTEFRIPLNKFS